MWLKSIYNRNRNIENEAGILGLGLMKRSWVSNLVVGGVILVLTLFLGLQYNWQRQASLAERERMQRRVEADARSMADDFNREMQAAYFNFQMSAEDWESENWSAFNQRYDYWKGRTQYPELIVDLVYFGKKPKTALSFRPESGVFLPIEMSESLVSLRTKLEGGDFKPFDEETYALVMPVHKGESRFQRIVIERPKIAPRPVLPTPERHGFLVIMLDRATITDRILPDLATKYFSGGDFDLNVENKAGEQIFQTAGILHKTDAQVPLFDLAPDNMIFFANREMLAPDATKPRAASGEHIESHTFTRTENVADGNQQGAFTIKLKPGGAAAPGGISKTRTSVIATRTTGSDDPWTLSAQHVAGSIDSFIEGERNKSFAIGLGVYLLLVGAIVAIVLSALRSKRFAQQQLDFVSSVSHEFRTPLAVIYSASENLADGVTKDHEQVSRYGNLIKGEGKKLSSMVEQILEFAGARSGRKKYNFTLTSVSNVANTAVSECRPLLEEKGFEVLTAIPDNLPPISVDADALSSAIQNLIQNSIKYSNGSRWISVSACNGDGRIKLSVSDRGIGIAARDLKHIFEPFYRAKDVVDAQIHGNGLGLALVKEIAEAHGGSVGAKGEPGKGSEFTIEIPQA